MDNQDITIGTQTWCTKNLDVNTYRNGDEIPEVKEGAEWKKAGEEGKGVWCVYENKAENGIRYGKLYNWYAVNDPRGLAPKGYHIPSDEEWMSLTNYLGGEETAGTKLKSASGWKKESVEYGGEGNGTNSSGFSALPGGFLYYNGTLDHIGGSGFWWSSTEERFGVWSRMLSHYNGGFYKEKYSCDKKNGLSVRCLKDLN